MVDLISAADAGALTIYAGEVLTLEAIVRANDDVAAGQTGRVAISIR